MIFGHIFAHVSQFFNLRRSSRGTLRGPCRGGGGAAIMGFRACGAQHAPEASYPVRNMPCVACHAARDRHRTITRRYIPGTYIHPYIHTSVTARSPTSYSYARTCFGSHPFDARHPVRCRSVRENIHIAAVRFNRLDQISSNRFMDSRVNERSDVSRQAHGHPAASYSRTIGESRPYHHKRRHEAASHE